MKTTVPEGAVNAPHHVIIRKVAIDKMIEVQQNAIVEGLLRSEM